MNVNERRTREREGEGWAGKPGWCMNKTDGSCEATRLRGDCQHLIASRVPDNVEEKKKNKPHHSFSLLSFTAT